MTENHQLYVSYHVFRDFMKELNNISLKHLENLLL
jgi:hypothetical protein